MTRTFLAALASLMISAPAFAAPVVSGVDEVCAGFIEEAVVKAATERYGADTMETFSVRSIRLNTAGSADFDMIRLFTVETSDEVGQGRWLVVTDDEDCIIEHVSIGSEN